jgi:hypothetical protein
LRKMAPKLLERLVRRAKMEAKLWRGARQA